MSTQAKPEYVEEELSEQAVCHYLAEHPDFFRHKCPGFLTNFFQIILTRLRLVGGKQGK